jgi:hypothetical protein
MDISRAANVTTIAGELTVRLESEGRRIRKVTVRSTRPVVAPRVVNGRTPAAAAAMIPALFGICAQAQGAAAAAALAAAEGRACSPGTSAALADAVRLEAVQEYLWRVLLDWPRAMGRAPVADALAAARRRIAAVLARPAAERMAAAERSAVAASISAIATSHVYGMAPADWLAQPDAAALGAWARDGRTLPAALLAELMDGAPRLGASDVPLMPRASCASLRSDIVPELDRGNGFAGTPTWAGVPVETGALARRRSHPLVSAVARADGHSVATRMVARLVELALLIEGQDDAADTSAWVEGLTLGEGDGLAAVQTARGLLLHRARLAGGRVADYQIVAPTEWNFHPDGALARGLLGIEARDDAGFVRSAQLVVQALDPCVACRVEVGHA